MPDSSRSAPSLDRANQGPSPDLFHNLMKISTDLLIILDSDHHITAVNHDLITELGMEPSFSNLCPGHSLACLNQQEGAPACPPAPRCLSCAAAKALGSLAQPPSTHCPVPAQVRGRDHQDRILGITARPLKLDAFSGALVHARDMTDHQFWSRLEQTFFHDVNNTLTPLYGSIQLLQMQQPLDPDIQACQRNVERLMAEVAFQKRVSRFRHRTRPPVFHPTTTDDIRRQVRMALQDHSSAYGKRFLNTWPEPGAALTTDPLLAAKVILLMCIHALNATEAGGHIRLSTRVTDRAVTWEVWTPSAIPQEDQDGFFRHRPIQETEQEKDLGPHAMKRFGEDILKGRMGVTSDPETGTRLSFTLPR